VASRKARSPHLNVNSKSWVAAGAGGQNPAVACPYAFACDVGVALFAVLPKPALDDAVAAMFLFGAICAWREGTRDEGAAAAKAASKHGVILTAFVVIFLAEWGDLTQVLTVNLAARYHSALSVAVGSVLALSTVAALAVVSGQTLLRSVDIATIRKITAVILLVLSA
jgi:putative Ca2+/H+ antiporter (TMEM165/GDT1 family)